MGDVAEEFQAIDLDARKRQRSTTPRDQRKRCPNPKCESVDVRRLSKRSSGRFETPEDAEYHCLKCGNYFDRPLQAGGRGA